MLRGIIPENLLGAVVSSYESNAVFEHSSEDDMYQLIFKLYVNESTDVLVFPIQDLFLKTVLHSDFIIDLLVCKKTESGLVLSVAYRTQRGEADSRAFRRLLEMAFELINIVDVHCGEKDEAD